jgi:hypothetical protein
MDGVHDGAGGEQAGVQQQCAGAEAAAVHDADTGPTQRPGAHRCVRSVVMQFRRPDSLRRYVATMTMRCC